MSKISKFIILLGRSGAGKSTLASKIKSHAKDNRICLSVISIGDMLRSMSSYDKVIRMYTTQGRQVPDSVIHVFFEPERLAADFILLDNYPQSLESLISTNAKFLSIGLIPRYFLILVNRLPTPDPIKSSNKLFIKNRNNTFDTLTVPMIYSMLNSGIHSTEISDLDDVDYNLIFSDRSYGELQFPTAK